MPTIFQHIVNLVPSPKWCRWNFLLVNAEEKLMRIEHLLYFTFSKTVHPFLKSRSTANFKLKTFCDIQVAKEPNTNMSSFLNENLRSPNTKQSLNTQILSIQILLLYFRRSILLTRIKYYIRKKLYTTFITHFYQQNHLYGSKIICIY